MQGLRIIFTILTAAITWEVFAMPGFLANRKNEKRQIDFESRDADVVAKARTFHAQRNEERLNDSFNVFDKCNEQANVVESAKCKKSLLNGEKKLTGEYKEKK